MNFKNIHIGNLIGQQVAESGTDMSRICNFMNCTEDEIKKMLSSENLPTDILLKWSKLLEYDFFRLYSQHLILFAPPAARHKKQEKHDPHKSALPQFRKSIYSKEVIDFCLEQIATGKMTKNKVIERYCIPKTTLYKWISKYGNSGN
ncbi:transposase [Chryseobacterium contaminans]|uniref:Transposase n=1 Tax=Chryseobacterium contaminans TaxID=1423959 RepID=A0ABX2X637_9FLAO|nr:transposase [Chryseobacterium contaminans]